MYLSHTNLQETGLELARKMNNKMPFFLVLFKQIDFSGICVVAHIPYGKIHNIAIETVFLHVTVFEIIDHISFVSQI